MKAWFKRLSQREQLYLLAAAAAVLLYVSLAVIWGPLASARDEMAARNAQVAQQLRQVRAMVSELRQFGAEQTGADRVNMNELINSTTQSLGILPTRIQPNARGETQVRFERVGFGELMRWLHRLDGVEGVRIREVTINQGDRGGAVRATVRLGLPSPSGAR